MARRAHPSARRERTSGSSCRVSGSCQIFSTVRSRTGAIASRRREATGEVAASEDHVVRRQSLDESVPVGDAKDRTVEAGGVVVLGEAGELRRVDGEGVDRVGGDEPFVSIGSISLHGDVVLLARSARSGVRIAIEPLNRFETSLVDTAAWHRARHVPRGHRAARPRRSRPPGSRHLLHVQACEADHGSPGGDNVDRRGVSPR